MPFWNINLGLKNTMKIRYLLAFCCILTYSAFSQTTINRNPDVAEMVEEVNSDSLKSYITTLVDFGTRSTVSDTKSKKKGIGAARNWMVYKFNQFAKHSDGRLTAYLDTITYKPDGKRVDTAISLGNAVAILKGTDKNDKRIFIITAHLDSRVSDIMNRKSAAQ